MGLYSLPVSETTDPLETVLSSLYPSKFLQLKVFQMIMKKFSLFAIAIALAGCTNLGQLQANCEATTSSFPQMVECLKVQVANDGRMRNSQEIKLYMLKADQLSGRVAKGAVSEIDAKVELQQIYVQLKQQETSNAMAAYAARPRMSNCYPVGNTVQCNTY